MSKVEFEEIQKEVDAFAEAWSRGDAKATAAFHTEDGIRVGVAGEIRRGRAEIEGAYAELLGGQFAGAKVTPQRGTLRALAPGLALWQCVFEITKGDAAPVRGYVVHLMKRIGNRWLILESHPKLFPSA